MGSFVHIFKKFYLTFNVYKSNIAIDKGKGVFEESKVSLSFFVNTSREELRYVFNNGIYGKRSYKGAI